MDRNGWFFLHIRHGGSLSILLVIIKTSFRRQLRLFLTLLSEYELDDRLVGSPTLKQQPDLGMPSIV